jgi:hypothetical protein
MTSVTDLSRLPAGVFVCEKMKFRNELDYQQALALSALSRLRECNLPSCDILCSSMRK